MNSQPQKTSAAPNSASEARVRVPLPLRPLTLQVNGQWCRPLGATPTTHTLPSGYRRSDAPPSWPFGTLTERQLRERRLFEIRLRNGRLAKWPEALL